MPSSPQNITGPSARGPDQLPTRTKRFRHWWARLSRSRKRLVLVWLRERETDEFWLAGIRKVDRDLAQTTNAHKRERLEDRKKYAVATLGESEPRHRRLRLFDYAKECFEEVSR